MNIVAEMKKELSRFKKLAPLTAEKPSVDRIHDLRVSSRKLKSEFWLVPKEKRSQTIKKANRDLKELIDVLGEKRKFDVALKDARKFGLDDSEIKKRRKEASRGVEQGLKAKRLKKYVQHLQKAVEEVAEIDPLVYRSRLQLLADRLERFRQKPPEDSAERHLLRIELKKVRYILKALQKEIPSLEKIQDSLGRWHDLRVLSDLSGETKEIREEESEQWNLAVKDLKAVVKRANSHLIDTIESFDKAPA